MRKVLIICLFLGFISHSFAQNKKVLDSLNIVYLNAKHDTISILSLLDIAWEYRNNKPDTCIKITQKALVKSESMNYSRGLAKSYNIIGGGNYIKGNYSVSLEFYQKSLQKFEEIKDKKGVASSLNNIGLIYREQDNYLLALEYWQKSVKMKEEIGDRKGLAPTFSNMGTVYRIQGNMSLALEFYQKSLQVYEEFNNKSGIATCLNNIAKIYSIEKNWVKAIETFERNLNIQKVINDKLNSTYALEGLADVYFQQKDYDKSLEYAQEGFRIAQEIKALAEKKMLCHTLYLIYKRKSEYSKALEYYELYKQMNDSLFNVEKAKAIGNLEARAALDKKEKEVALLTKDNELKKLNAEKQARELEITKKQAEANQLFALARAEKDKRKQDSLYNLAQKSQLEAKNLKIQEEKNRLEQEKKALAYEAEVADQKNIRNTFLVLSSALIFIVALVVFSLRQKQKSNQLLASQKLEIENKNKNLQDANQEIQTANEELYQTQEEILAQRDLLENKNNLLEQYTNKISKSIEAAQMIQKAILPPKAKMKELFGEHFVLFRPKDIVSGDFWWANEIDGKKYLIVADCTGHGVSGAMLTMIGSALLDRIIRLMGIAEPSEILTKLHEEIKAVLQQEQTQNNEGMDIAITHWHYENENCVLSFAAAKRPLIYTNDGKIEKVGGSRRNVGGITKSIKSFEATNLILSKGSALYLSSDGFADQNDVARNNFSEKRFIDLLQQIQDLSMEQQKGILQEQLQKHMAGTEQRDDILVIGVRI